MIIIQLNTILNRSGRTKGFRLNGKDKINAEELLNDLQCFLKKIKKF